MWSEWWNRFLASDPALRRLRNACRVTLSVAITLAIMIPVLDLAGQSVRAALMGGIIAINSVQPVNDNTERARRTTTLLCPLPAIGALVVATASQPLPVLNIGLFVVVIFTATYIRRFGPRFFAFGMVGFMGYFFSMFLRPTVAQLPYLVLAIVVASLSAYVVRFFLISDNPHGILDRGRNTLQAQVHGLLHAVGDLAGDPESAKLRRRLQNRSVRLNETALMLENTVQELESVPATQRTAARQRILDVELAAENLLTPLMRIVEQPGTDHSVPQTLRAFLAVLRADPSNVREASRRVSERVERDESPEVAMAVRRLGSGLAELANAAGELGGRDPDLTGDEEEPDTAEALQGEPEAEPTGLARPELRSAIQATCAGALAIAAGELINPTRWYWAVITAFLVFISTNSRGELLVRAWQRTAGTLLGVVAGVLVASQVTGNTTAELAVILVCIFLAFYFAGYLYAALTFFITTMLGTLYGVLGQFNVSVLEVRLFETAAGATAGVLAAVLILPMRTRSLVQDNAQALLRSLRDFLRGTGTNVSHASTRGLRESVREVDDRLQQLLTSARPLTNYRLVNKRSQVDRSLTVAGGCAYYVRNLSVVLPTTVDMVDEDTRHRLAEWLWALADAAESMVDETDLDFETAIRPARERSDQLHDIVEALSSGPSSLHRTTNLLDRITQTLGDLARELGRSTTAERVPTGG